MDKVENQLRLVRAAGGGLGGGLFDPLGDSFPDSCAGSLVPARPAAVAYEISGFHLAAIPKIDPSASSPD